MKMMFRPLRQSLLLALALGFVAPLLAQTQVHQIDQQDLYRYWIQINPKVQMDAPNSGLNIDKPGCAAVTYTVGSDGVPMDVQVAKLVPKSDLGPAARQFPLRPVAEQPHRSTRRHVLHGGVQCAGGPGAAAAADGCVQAARLRTLNRY